MINTGVSAFTASSLSTNTHTSLKRTGFAAPALVNRQTVSAQMPSNGIFSKLAPVKTPPSIRLQAVPDSGMDASEKVSDHPAFLACERSKMLSRMERPDRAQVQHLNKMATLGVNKIDKGIKALQQGNPEMLKRAALLFGDQVETKTLIDGLKSIRADLDKVRKVGAYAVDTEVDDCPCEAFTIVQELPEKQEPFVIFLRGYFFNPPKEMSMMFKTKEDYQAHSLVHEATHLALRSYDVELSNGMPAYSPYGCMALAKEQPNRTVDNADSWAWLVH